MNKPQISALLPNGKNSADRDVYIDGEFYMTVPLLLLMEQELSVGSPFGEEEEDALLLAAQLVPAKEKAYQYLSYGDLSRKTLREKLVRFGIEERVANAACDKLEAQGLLDDERLARHLARRYAEEKRWGPRRIEQELRNKGIGYELAKEAIAELETDFYETACYQVANKYRRADLSDPKERHRVFMGLVRLGFDFETARAALEMDYED